MLVRRQHVQKLSTKSGVTILEILVVLSIIAMISAVVAPRLIGYLGRGKSETAKLQVEQLRNAVQLFYIDVGRYPAGSEGLAVLMERPTGVASWNGPYMDNKTALKDPWGRDYIYVAPVGEEQFHIGSMGRDGAEGGTGEDADISR